MDLVALPVFQEGFAVYENTDKFVDMDFEQKVRQAAYHLWENDGRPIGRETDYWFRALETLLRDRSAVGNTAQGDGLPS
ncbi:hypothetical protein ASD83_13435 [Devosia sp. Root685]|nr:hypothetical protein ASD83_13435 [Devosia sp. Root685]